VMRTFFALRHMGNVEWVTDHVPWSHSRGGAVNDAEVGSLTLYLVAERREMAGFVVGPEEVWPDGTSTTMVVPPGDSPGRELHVAAAIWSAIYNSRFWPHQGMLL
jgi:hypothetical protein